MRELLMRLRLSVWQNSFTMKENKDVKVPAPKEGTKNNTKRNALIVCCSIFITILCAVIGLAIVNTRALKAKNPTGLKNVIVTSEPSWTGDRRSHTLVLVLSEMKWTKDLENRASKSYRHLARSILEKVNAIGEKNFHIRYEKILLTSIWRFGENVGVNFEIIFRCNADQNKSIQSRLEEDIKQLWSSRDTGDFRMILLRTEKTNRLRRQIGQEEGCGANKKLCNDGSCVFRSWWCNGQADCPDGSDEINCSNNEQATTTPSSESPSTTPYASEYTSNVYKGQSTQKAEYTTENILTTAGSQRYTTYDSQSTSVKYEYSASPPIKNSNSTHTTPDYNESEEYLSSPPINRQTDPPSTPKSKTKIYDPFNADGEIAPELVTTDQYKQSSPGPRTDDDFSCRSGSYMCDTGACIPRSWVCDNVTDCTDWSDETEDACDLPPVMNHPGLERVSVYKFTEYAGRAAVRYNGTWGNICDDYWDKRDADVFCRTWLPGIETEGFIRRESYYSPTSGVYPPILLDAVDCMGHETNFSYCPGPPLGQADCSTTETAGVLCQPNIDGIRLVNGNNPRQGRVQLLVGGVWGTICDRYGWDEKAAQVVCRMLNFTGPAYNVSRINFGSPTSVNLVVGAINCTGLEFSIKDCWASNAGQGVVGDSVTGCESHMAAGISCGIKICKSGEILCSDLNTCIKASVLCDGLWDCPGGTDESNCSSTCGANQFVCSDNKRCINMTQRCDGDFNCDDGADERSCVMEREEDETVVAFDKGSMMPICYNPDTETELGESVCRSLGMRGLIEIIPTNKTDVGVEVLKTTDRSSLLGFRFQQQQNCRLFKVNCFDDGCGIRGPRFVAPFVNNGRDATAGEWRWQIRLLKDGVFACGGSILSTRHIITANHCVRGTNARDLLVQVGKLNRVGIDRSEVSHTVKKITSNPLYYRRGTFSTTSVHDVAILELDKPIEINRFLGTVCLPDNNTDITISDNCFITGWGRNQFDDLPTVLQETRVNIINHTVCNQLYDFTTSPLSSMVCVDHPTSLGSAANKGDSGGPLVCEDSNGRWVLMGITGYITQSTSVYHKVQHYVDWIKTQLTKDCNFVCDWNTKCLTADQICDGTLDCIDKTDEKVHCGGNCTFERGNTCGYRIRDEIDGWRVFTDTPVTGISVLEHGYRPSTSQIESPRLDNLLPACVVLQIERDVRTDTDGIIGSGTSLRFETVEATQNRSTVFWNLPIERPLVLQQNISENVVLFEITSEVKQNETYRIYTIKILPGSCPPLVCNESTTPCDDMSMCIPDAHVCNGLPQCPDGSDEKNCTSFVSVSCTFDHQFYCGYGQKDSSNLRYWDSFRPHEYSGLRGNKYGVYSTMIGGYIAPLFSPIFSVTTPSCYLFEFGFPNSNSSYLNVSLHDISRNETQIVWAQKYHRGNVWRLGQFNLFPGRYQVYFVTESSLTGVHNIKLLPQPCLQDVYSCSLDEFTCMDGQCISGDLACDDSPNCNDQSDLTKDNGRVQNPAPTGILRIDDESSLGKGLVQVQINNTWEHFCVPRLFVPRSNLQLCNILGYRELSLFIGFQSEIPSSFRYDCGIGEPVAETCFQRVSACSLWFIRCTEPIQPCIPEQKVATSSELIPRERIRLQGDLSQNEGRVEVFFNNTWGTVCGRAWSVRESTAVCRTLGFRGESRKVENKNPGTGRIWLDDKLLCRDTEQFFDCNRSSILPLSCTHYDDVAIQCSQGCFSDEVECGDGKTCIQSNSLCDGENDCPAGDDERSCSLSCRADQFVCDRYSKCISMSSRCDGIMDCQDGADEFNCVQLSDNGVAMMVVGDALYPVCNEEQLGGELSNMLCQSMGEWGAYGFENGEVTEQGVYVVNSTRTLLSSEKTIRGCIMIKPLCIKRDCGRSNSVLDIHSVNDEWIGQVSMMSTSGSFLCYGTLISFQIVMVTVNCARTASYAMLDGRRLEWNNSTTESPFVLFHLIVKVSDPVCLPDPSTEKVNKCYLVETKYDPQYGKPVLRPVKVKMYNRTECSKKFPTLNITDRMACASLGTERSPICFNQTYNDLSRLLCKDRFGFWIFMGLFLNQPFECVMENGLENVALFHSIPHYSQQIFNHIDCPFRCDVNHCIATSNVCDGVYNCVDKSDETRFCNVTCDFEEDPFVCGFQFTVESSGWDVKSGDERVRDHTVRSNATSSMGHYLLYANSSQTFTNESALLSPTFSVSSEACLEFYYWMPSSEVDLIVNMEDLDSGASEEVFSRSNRQGNRWRLAQISLPPGRYRAHFHPTANHSASAVGLDDFTLREGSCREGVISCAVDEYRCTENQCIMLEDTCNVIHQSCANTSTSSILCSRKSSPTTAAPETDQIRLVGGTSSREGRVEIFHNGVWGTICDDDWGTFDARVVCKMLGLSGGTPFSLALFGIGAGQIWLDSVGCFGSESHIADCSHDPWGTNDCTHFEDASVRCTAPTTDRPSVRPSGVRLIGEQPGQGRVEVFHDGRWGTVCNDNWDNKDASVVCKSLGYRIGINYRLPISGRGSGTIWLDEVKCDGMELSIFQCPSNRLGVNDCSHTEDVGVTCTGFNGIIFPPAESATWISPIPVNVSRNNSIPLEESVRLQGGTTPLEGRVEVFVNGIWGTVCSDLWGELESIILCKTMGYNSGTIVSIANYSNGQGGPIWLDDVQCTANSTDIFNCSSAQFGFHDCDHYQDVAVRCNLCGPEEVSCNDKCCPNNQSMTAHALSCLNSGVGCSECDSEEFWCGGSTCIPLSFLCDGEAHCPGAEDEGSHCVRCDSEKEFKCANGLCTARSNVCNNVRDCLDGSDEFNCSKCDGFMCSAGNKCIPVDRRCDGRIDCQDFSDETGCERNCTSFQCKNSICLFSVFVCNGDDDCGDGSDEANCECTSEEVSCDNGRCIPSSWLCDDFADCSDSSDEKNCSSCSGNETICIDYSCVPAMSWCNGTVECPDGSDETSCVNLEDSLDNGGLLKITHVNITYPVCSIHWSDGASTKACTEMGMGKAMNTLFIQVNHTGDEFLVLEDELDRNKTNLVSSTTRSRCSSQEAVHLTCQPKGCGQAIIGGPKYHPFIVGGEISGTGSWPFVGLLYYLNKARCGVTVISDKWVVTAAHCVREKRLPHYFKIMTGATNRFVPGERAQYSNVDRIIVYPNFTLSREVLPYDIALLRLETPLNFTAYVQPICLPSSDFIIPMSATCFTAGFGTAVRSVKNLEADLREGKLRPLSDTSCEESYNYRINSTDKLCAGYTTGIITPCFGDSGGPLMCEVDRNQWTLTGIVSIGDVRCRKQTFSPVKPSAFTRITSYVAWIREITNVGL